MTRIPSRSVFSKNSSRSSRPSRRIAFMPISRTYARSASSFADDHRKRRSGAQAAPRIKTLLPLILNNRCFFSVSSEVTSRIRNVTHFPADGQLGGFVFGIQLGGPKWIAHRHIPARPQKYFLPNPHVLVGRRRIPIHPGDPQVVLSWSEHLDRQRILLPRLQKPAHVEFVRSVGARDVVRIRHLLPVDPDVRPVVDAQKIQPLRFLRLSCRRGELPAIPPRAAKRTPVRHVLI